MNRSEWSKRRGRSSSYVRRSLRLAIYARDGFACVYCPRREVRPTLEGLTLDHVEPRSEGGTHTPGNLVTACTRCNSRGGYLKADRNARERARRHLRKPIDRKLGRALVSLIREHAIARAASREPQLEKMLRRPVPDLGIRFPIPLTGGVDW